MAASSSLLSSLILLCILFTFTEANEVLVGGKPNSWKIPSSQSESLNKWAEQARFQMGDTLVLHFNPEKDSVLQVTKKDYKSCNISSPLVKYQNETTMIELNKSGPYYFISGAKGHCEQGQKMIVVVISGVHTFRGRISPAPAPSPMVVEYDDGSPAVAPSPTSGAYDLRGNGYLFLVLGSWFLRVFLL
ncbi:hypothetical protein ACHQM5_023020 [Ranunculus cassubicifolius]